MDINRSPDYVGLWRREKIKNSEDYSLFYMWTDSMKLNAPFTGISIEEAPNGLAIARIGFGSFEDNKIYFAKSYTKQTLEENHSLLRNTIEYMGQMNSSQGTYEGFFSAANNQDVKIIGKFSLGRHIEDVEDVFTKCKGESLDGRIFREKNFLNLKEVVNI